MNPVDLGICEKSQYGCRNTFDSMQMVLGIAYLLPLFSLITYKMREEVFKAWWGFARWFVPIIIIIIVTLLMNASSSSGGLGIGGVAAGVFEFLILFLLHAIFLLVSIVRITMAYRRSKNAA